MKDKQIMELFFKYYLKMAIALREGIERRKRVG